MIIVSNLSVQYGGRFLFDDISFAVTAKDRVGLVGKNGAGKSTLLRILMREMRPEAGNITLDGNATLGYLPQDMRLNPTQTVYEETAKAFAQLQETEKLAADLTEQLAERTDYTSAAYERLINQIADAEERIGLMGGLNKREEVERVLRGLGFVSSDMDRPLSEFSGGWQMRTELAKLLLQRPDFILLDEPTNHLDIESIIWLENFLLSYPGGVMLISHDRAFLDRATNRTIELVSGKLYDYRAPYSQYMELREQRIEKQIADAKRQSKEIEHTQGLIEKFRAKKNKAAFAQTLIRKLEKTERISIDEMEDASIRFRFPEAPRSGRVVVDVQQLSKQYGQNLILNNIELQIERGEKVAFVGKNGEGKTTLTRIITGKTDANGKCEVGYNVSVGYFEQHQAEHLDPNKTVFQTIDDVASGEMRYRVRALLGAFLFSGEDVEKKVMVLSGGEKSRLALAKMLLEPVNLLILDEPTNHLDMQAKEILKQALFDYNGTLIVVSHDRDFLSGLTDCVYEFNNKAVKKYTGDVYDFLAARKINTLDELNLGLQKQQRDADRAQSNNVENKQQRGKQNTYELDKEIKSVQNKVTKSERKIEDLETKIATCEQELNSPDFYQKQLQPDAFLQKYTDTKKELQTEMEAWELLTLELEALKEEKDKLK